MSMHGCYVHIAWKYAIQWVCGGSFWKIERVVTPSSSALPTLWPFPTFPPHICRLPPRCTWAEGWDLPITPPAIGAGGWFPRQQMQHPPKGFPPHTMLWPNLGGGGGDALMLWWEYVNGKGADTNGPRKRYFLQKKPPISFGANSHQLTWICSRSVMIVQRIDNNGRLSCSSTGLMQPGAGSSTAQWFLLLRRRTCSAWQDESYSIIL